MSDASTALEIIRSVAQTMQESVSTRPALEAVVKLISEKMEVDVCSIYLYQGENNRLRLAASEGLNRENLSDVTMSPGEGLTGYVFSRGEIVNIANPSDDKRNKHFPTLGEDRLKNFLGIPIPPASKWGAGVITLQSTEGVPFSPMVEDLAYTLAAQLGTLLENRSLRSVSPMPGNPEAEAPKEAPPFVRAQVAVGGIADGRAVILKTHQIWDTIIFAECQDPGVEIQLLQQALELARQESQWLKKRAGELFAELDARIFEAHELMLTDEHYIGLIESHIRENLAAPFAVKLATREIIKSMLDTGNVLLSSRAADLRDVGLRILNALGEAKQSTAVHDQAEDGNIVAAVELLPSDLIYLSTRKILGILCETGGLTSHAAILARSLGIPCFMGIPGLTGYLQNNTRVIMDGNTGLIYINPDAHIQREYSRLLEDLGTRMLAVPSFESVTRDGERIHLSGNLSLISDLELMEQYGIEGVGLYRSEFFFMIRSSFPDEETQFEIYRRVLERCGAHGATFRLLDVGGDKPLKYFDWGKEENPSLGWRSIRMLISRPDILRPHLRALLRTAQLGEFRLVIPMLSMITEFRVLKAEIQAVLNELEAEAGHSLRMPPIGAMIEIPSAMMQIRDFAAEADFLSIGTNDMIQYLFAIDRGNERVASYYQPFHPALIQALMRIAAAGRDAGKSVTVCGEMASDPQALPIFLALGITHLSIAPAAADAIRTALRCLSVKECKRLLGKISNLHTADQVKAELNAFLESIPVV
ncbi:MAG: domain phosphoenolpyruvate--protein phosphotransferase PtsP [Fibrobacteres bacterium]|nr:domain phosphoenolpyruvate--protein phosphotransferase PtsP [Fibrobacterota bacterium]